MTRLHVKSSRYEKSGYMKETYKVPPQESQDQSTQALPYPSQSQTSQPQANQTSQASGTRPAKENGPRHAHASGSRHAKANGLSPPQASGSRHAKESGPSPAHASGSRPAKAIRPSPSKSVGPRPIIKKLSIVRPTRSVRSPDRTIRLQKGISQAQPLDSIISNKQEDKLDSFSNSILVQDCRFGL